MYMTYRKILFKLDCFKMQTGAGQTQLNIIHKSVKYNGKNSEVQGQKREQDLLQKETNGFSGDNKIKRNTPIKRRDVSSAQK